MRTDKETVVITGGTGLIGTALARALSRRYEVVALDRESREAVPGVRFVDVDMASGGSVRKALAHVRRAHGERIASVVHLAAYYDFSGAPSELYERVTVRGTARLLNALQDFDVGQFLFSSTVLVHAPCRPGERINEDSPLEPKWEYPKSKVRAEELIRAARGRVPALILRIAGVYDDLCHSIPLAHQISRIYERRLVGHVYPGDASHGQPFVHIGDVVTAISNAVDRRADLPAEEVLLIGESETMSYADLQREFSRLIHGKEWETYVVPKPIAKAGAWLQDRVSEPFIKPWMIALADDHFALDVARAHKRIDWSPTRSLRATLPRMIAALKRDPLAWYRENKLRIPGRVRRAAGA